VARKTVVKDLIHVDLKHCELTTLLFSCFLSTFFSKRPSCGLQDNCKRLTVDLKRCGI